MRISEWEDYELLDASAGERLERFKDIFLIRPDPQVIWETARDKLLWGRAHARYRRSKDGGGSWEIFKKIPENWELSYKSLTFNLKLMGFKHTGIFPEQATNWDLIENLIKTSGKNSFEVLNLFSYTGGATLAALKAGSQVCHVDASKGIVSIAKENVISSRLNKSPVRFMVDDCVKFVNREINRGNKYNAIILDPPSFGRGPSGNVWKIEKDIFDFLQLCSKVLTQKPSFVILNSYSAGLLPSVMEYLLEVTINKRFKGRISSDEIGLKVKSTKKELPCGSTAIWQA